MTTASVNSRPHVGVLGYGSFIAPTELDDLFDDWDQRSIPVTVDGFRRAFNQEASWRETNGNQRAVLNVEPQQNTWCNAVLLPDLSRSEYVEYRQRERGYRLIEVDVDSLSAYENSDEAITSLDLVLIAVGDRTNEEFEPIQEYLELCLSGAEYWGPQFKQDFLTTTEVTPGQSLAEYLETGEGMDASG